MRVALMVEGQEGVSWDEWLALAAACEEHGVEAMFRSDHYLSPTDTNRTATDAWTLLGALAAHTSRLRRAPPRFLRGALLGERLEAAADLRSV